MGIYGLKQNFVIRPSPFEGNEKGLDKKNPTKFCFRSILGCMLNSYIAFKKVFFISPRHERGKALHFWNVWIIHEENLALNGSQKTIRPIIPAIAPMQATAEAP